jgi:radical SAM protein with 4Fe4S-binding SPASM domain
MDPKQKFFLFKQSKNFCAAPWTNLYLESDGNIYTCCVGKTKIGNIRESSIDNVLSGPVLRKIKQDLLEDTPNKNCEICQKRDVDSSSWLQNYYNKLALSSDVDYNNLDEFYLVSTDMRWSNTCNFMCVYCSPVLSSSLEKESGIIVRNGSKGNSELLEWIINHQSTIKEVYLAGGEPLLMKENQVFLEKLDKSIKLRINTNLSNINDKNLIFSLIDQFENIEWTVSVDNTANRYEYTRYNGSWLDFLSNLTELKNNTKNKIIFNMVYFVGNAVTLKDDILFLLETCPDARVNVNAVEGKSEIEVCNLPDRLKTIARDNLIELLKIEQVNKRDLEYCIAVLNQQSTDQRYQYYFDSIDKKRNTNWKNIFPELVD